MDAGLIKRADYFGLHLVPTASYGGSGGVFSSQVCTHFRDFGNDLQVGINLRASYAPPGLWNVSVEVPTLGLFQAWGAQTTGVLETRLYTNIYSFDSFYTLYATDLEIYLDGVLTQTWTIGVRSSFLTGRWPSTIPLIGIPPVIAAVAAVAVPDDPTIPGSATAEGSLTGGYKWVVDGVDEAYPTELPSSLIAPPGIACATGGGTLPNVTTVDTWNSTAEAYATASWNATASTGETRASQVRGIPVIPRRYRRIGSDYGAMPIRYALPEAQQHGLTECTAWTPPASPVTTTADSYATEVTARATLKDFVEAAPHVFEDALNDTPKSLFQRETRTFQVARSGGLMTFSGSRRDVSEFTGCSAPSSDFVAGLATTEEVTRYWDFLCNPHESHKLFFTDDVVRGANRDPRTYWCPIRQQWCSVNGTDPALRNNVVLDAIGNATGWHDLYYAVGIRNLGATRFQVANVTPWTSLSYGPESEDLWTFGDCAGSFGATEVTLTPAATDIYAELDLGSFEVYPYMAVHLADHLKLTWDTSNIASITWSLVGIDGAVTVVAATSGVSLAKPRGTSNKYAGSWGTDNGNGEFVQTGTDTGAHASDGISLLSMADAERVHAFLMAPGSTYAKLRVDIEVTNPLLTCKFTYPEFTRSEGSDPDLVWESGQACALLYKDNAGVRFGNAYWYSGGLSSLPSVRGLGKQQTAIDGEVNSRIWLTAQAKDDGLDAQNAALFDAIEGQSQDKVDVGTSSVILPDPTWSRVQYAIVNEAAEVPPLLLCPRRERDSDWEETGDWCLDAWSWCIQSQRYIAPGSVPLHLKTPDGATTLTTVEAGYNSGWKVTERHDAVDNSEVDDYLLFYDSEERAQASPWPGYFGVFGLSVSGGAVSYDVSRSMRHVRAFIESGLVWVGTAANSPLPLAFLDNVTTLAADWVCVRWNLNTLSQQLLMAVELAGSIKIVSSNNFFATWSLTGHTVTGTKPTLVVSDSGSVLMYYIDGGSVKVKLYSQTLGLISSATIVSCDDEGVAAYVQPKTGGGREFVLLYSSGGSVYRAVSSDGLTFGAGSVIGSGVKPLSFRGESGRHSEGWIDGSDLKVRTVDRNGNAVVATNTVATVDDAGADIAQSSGANGQWRTVVLFSESAALGQKYSFDSDSWT